MTDYITSAQLKATLSITGTTYADADIASAITSASRAIDNTCQRRFYEDADATSVRYYTPSSRTLLEIDDLVVLTSLLTSDDGTSFGNTWTVNTDFVLEPLNAAADSWPYTHMRVTPVGSFVFSPQFPRSVKVTGQFGWAAVPAGVVAATTMLANQILTTSRSAPMGIVAFEGGAIRISKANSQVMGLIAPYMRHRVGVG